MTTTTRTESAKPSLDGRAEHRSRHWARRLALQALYQWDINGGEAADLLKQFAHKEDAEQVNAQYFEQLLRGTLEHRETLDQELTAALDRPLKRLDPVERSVLRFACYELLHCRDIPIAVVLSEATGLAAKFGTSKGAKYVNAVLDQVASGQREPRVA